MAAEAGGGAGDRAGSGDGAAAAVAATAAGDGGKGKAMTTAQFKLKDESDEISWAAADQVLNPSERPLGIGKMAGGVVWTKTLLACMIQCLCVL